MAATLGCVHLSVTSSETAGPPAAPFLLASFRLTASASGVNPFPDISTGVVRAIRAEQGSFVCGAQVPRGHVRRSPAERKDVCQGLRVSTRSHRASGVLRRRSARSGSRSSGCGGGRELDLREPGEVFKSAVAECGD